MPGFIRKYHIYIWPVLIAALLIYDNYERKLYAKLFKSEGICTVGKIYEIKGYGRGAGYDFVYTFKISDKIYHSKTDIGGLNWNDAQTLKGKNFLVIYLKNNIHINRIYASIPVSKDFGNKKLSDYVSENPEIIEKLELIPSPGWFWENYF